MRARGLRPRLRRPCPASEERKGRCDEILPVCVRLEASLTMGRVEARGGEFLDCVDLAEAPLEVSGYRVGHVRPMVAKALVNDLAEFSISNRCR